MITHLLMDADHVLINKPELWSAKFSREHGVSIDEITPFFAGPFQDCLIGQADLKQILPPWLTMWHWEKSVNEFLEFWFTAEHFIDSELLEEIELLREHGLKVYVATNQEKYRTEYMRHQMGFSRQFDGIFASADLGEKKPDAVFFTKLLAKIGNPHPSKVMFWDDDQINVDGAKAVGIRAHQYTDVHGFKTVMEAITKESRV